MFSVLPKEEIIKGIRYDTNEKKSRLIAYIEAVEAEGVTQDKILMQGLNGGRLFLVYQKRKIYKAGDDSSKIIPVNLEEALRAYSDMAERLLPESVISEIIKA